MNALKEGVTIHNDLTFYDRFISRNEPGVPWPTGRKQATMRKRGRSNSADAPDRSEKDGIANRAIQVLFT